MKRVARLVLLLLAMAAAPLRAEQALQPLPALEVGLFMASRHRAV